MGSAEQHQRSTPCTCHAHQALRERGGPVTADDVRELAEAHLNADRRRWGLWLTWLFLAAMFAGMVLFESCGRRP